MASSDQYVALLTSEHRSKPNFRAVVALTTGAFGDTAAALASLVAAFDLDQAQGAQLDAIGLWVGVSRAVRQQITGLYFTLDDTATTGFDRGIWQGPYDPSTGIVRLDDATFRTLIRAKIAANYWDGTIGGMEAFWEYVFGPGVVTVTDNQDMTIVLLYDALQMTPLMQNLFTNGYFGMVPAGVLVSYAVASDNPIFTLDTATPKFQGFDLGYWN